MNNAEQVAIGPVIFLSFYEVLLSRCNKNYTPAQVLKCIGLFNTIAWRESQGHKVTLALLAEVLYLTKPGVLRLLACLRELNLVTVQDERQSITDAYVIRVDPRLSTYLGAVQQSVHQDDNARSAIDGLKIARLFNHSASRIMYERRKTDTPAFALQCMGFIVVIGWLQSKHGFVTRQLLADVLGMSKNAFRPKIEYLLHLNLITEEEIRFEDHIGREFRIRLTDPLAERLCYWLNVKQRYGPVSGVGFKSVVLPDVW